MAVIAEAVAPRPRALGILRVSEEGGRAERLAAHKAQEASIRTICEMRGLELIEPLIYERDVSGHDPLVKRPFGEAISRVEHQEAEAIVFAYRTRTDRSIAVGTEAIQRMDAADALLLSGSEVLTHKTTEGWRSATFGSFMGESQWRETRENSMKGVMTNISEHKVVPFKLPPGLTRTDLGGCEIDETLAPIIREAFAMRAGQATIAAVRAYLTEQGLTLSYRAVQIMLKSPLYIGELRYPAKPKKGAKHPTLPRPWAGKTFRVCDPIVDRHVWDAVQKMRVPSGRMAKSDRLLARLGVLRCASCGGRMVAGGQWASYTTAAGETRRTRYAFYKCGRGADQDCPNPCSISAERLEGYVLDHVKGIYADGRGRASQARQARDAGARAERTRAQLSTAKRRMMLLPEGENDTDALAVIEELTAQLERESAEAERLASISGVEIVNAARVLDSTDPDLLPHKRKLIRLALAQITVSPGRASVAERVGFEPLR